MVMVAEPVFTAVAVPSGNTLTMLESDDDQRASAVISECVPFEKSAVARRACVVVFAKVGEGAVISIEERTLSLLPPGMKNRDPPPPVPAARPAAAVNAGQAAQEPESIAEKSSKAALRTKAFILFFIPFPCL